MIIRDLLLEILLEGGPRAPHFEGLGDFLGGRGLLEGRD